MLALESAPRPAPRAGSAPEQPVAQRSGSMNFSATRRSSGGAWRPRPRPAGPARARARRGTSSQMSPPVRGERRHDDRRWYHAFHCADREVGERSRRCSGSRCLAVFLACMLRPCVSASPWPDRWSRSPHAPASWASTSRPCEKTRRMQETAPACNAATARSRRPSNATRATRATPAAASAWRIAGGRRAETTIFASASRTVIPRANRAARPVRPATWPEPPAPSPTPRPAAAIAASTRPSPPTPRTGLPRSRLVPAVLHTQPEWASRGRPADRRDLPGLRLWIGLSKLAKNPLQWFTGEPSSSPDRVSRARPGTRLHRAEPRHRQLIHALASRDCATRPTLPGAKKTVSILPDTRHAYRVFPYFGTWQESRDACAGLGAAAAPRHHHHRRRTRPRRLPNYRGYFAWIGATEPATKAPTSGSPASPRAPRSTTRRWHSPPPGKFPDDDCLVMSFRESTGLFRLEEMPCDRFNVFLCEIE